MILDKASCEQVLYNEFDDHAAEWLRNLVAAGLIARGTVDERSIVDLIPGDLDGRVQVHCFAGVGAWSLALRRAGWPDDCEVFTVSCPCQPFSTAGRGEGSADERHLWPAYFDLVRARRPAVILGEQVASPAVIGKPRALDEVGGDPGDEAPRSWLDAVQRDLESIGYVFGAAVVPAACVGAPHIRARTYFVALADGERLEGVRVQLRERRSQQRLLEVGGGGASDVNRDAVSGILGDARRAGGRGHARAVPGQEGEGEGERLVPGHLAHESVAPGAVDDRVLVADAERLERGQVGQDSGGRGSRGGAQGLDERPLHGSDVDGDAGILANSEIGGREQGSAPDRRETEFDRSRFVDAGCVDNTAGERSERCSTAGRQARDRSELGSHPRRLPSGSFPGAVRGSWADAEWVWCRDGRYRPAQPGVEPLSHGTATRVGCDGAVEKQSRAKKLAGYGNSLAVDAAVAFIESVVDLITET